MRDPQHFRIGMREISGDARASAGQKVIYMLFNLIRGFAGFNTRIKIQYWWPDQVLPGNESPGRQHLNQFLLKKLPEILPVGKINMLDIGCGTGYCRPLLAQLGYSGQYLGVDIKKNAAFESFDTPAFQSRFMQKDAEALDLEDRFDLVFSITALEHIPDDRKVIDNCNRLSNPGGIQVHVVPAFSSLFLYWRHGFRQYNPKRLKRLMGNKNYTVYRLGGAFSFLTHMLFITIPVHILRRDTWREKPICQKCVDLSRRLDRYLPFLSCNYVVVLRP